MLQELTQEVKNNIADMIRDMHTMIPARVISFDPLKCEASILPYGKFKMPDNSLMDFPKLNEVPVYVIQGSEQTAVITYPIKPGDECIVMFAEQALDTWRTKAESQTDLKFDLSNAIAIIGMFSRPTPLIKEACEDNSLIIEKDGERLRLKKGETYIRDTAGQSITMTPNATTMVVNNLIIKSKGNIDITAAGNITTIAGGNIKENAARIDHN